MKRKVVTHLEEVVLRRTRRRASDEGRPLSHVVQDALEYYLSVKSVDPAKRDAAYQLFCDSPMKLTSAQFRAVLGADGWDL